MQTLSKIIILLLLYSVQLSAQVTFPDPATIPTKEWVLEQIRLSKDSTITPTPIPDPKPDLVKCKEGPDIVRISAITSTGAVFQFHGVQVVELKWEIVGTAFSGTIKPTSNQIGIGYNLPAGTYTLRLQGVSCSGVSTKSFTVPEQSGGGGIVPVPIPDPAPTGSLPPLPSGVERSQSGNWEARFITGHRKDIKIDSEGKITDHFPDKYDQNGQRYSDLNGSRYNAYYLLYSHPIPDLKGLKLPTGLHYLQKMYVRASNFPTWESVNKAWWGLSPEDQKLLEVANTELLVVNGTDVGSSQPWLQPTFPPQFYKHPQKLSSHKILGFKNQYGVTDAVLLSSNISHLQDTGGGNDIAPDKKFTLAKLATAGGNANASEEEFRRQGYNYALNTGVNKKLVLTSEIGEELDNKGVKNKHTKTNAFAEGYVQAFRDRDQNVKISDIGIYGEYGGVGNQGDVGSTYQKPVTLEAYRQTMTSQEQARRLFEPSYNRFSETGQSTYFSLGRHAVQNVLIRQYFSSLADLNGGYFPNLVFTSQKMYLAASDRKQIGFSWEGIQDLIRLPNSFFDVADGWRYVFKEPAGKLYVGYNNGTQIPPYIAYGLGFLNPVLMEGLVVWSGSMPFKDVPLEGNHKNIFGGDYEGKGVWADVGAVRKWMPEGSSEWVDYGKGGEGMPAYHYNADKGFPKSPYTAIDAFYAGAADYARIESRLNKAKYWVKLSQDGGKNWYTPAAGTRGLELSDFEKPNYSDKHPAIDIAAFRLPIAIVGEGDAGSVLIYYNTYKLPTDSDNVVIEHKGKTYNIGQLQGSKIHTIPL